MSSAATSNPPLATESKSKKKKQAKAEVPANASNETSNAPSGEVGAGATPAEGTTNGVEGNYESPYLKELYKLDRLSYISELKAGSGCVLSWERKADNLVHEGISVTSTRNW